MIEHLVMLALPAEADTGEVQAIMQGLEALQRQLPGFESFSHGPNRDYEGKSAGFSYGFLCRFMDAQALEGYADDPAHRALGARLVAICQNGADGIMVFDIETERET